MGTVTNFPFGLSSFGSVLTGAGGPTSVPRPNGQSWFVDAAAGSDGGSGSSPSDPFKTIGRAVAMAGNGTGDTIYVAQGSYNETLVITKAALAIVGSVQAGYERPDWAPVLAAAIPLTVKAQGFMCRHVRFAANGNDACQQSGNGFLYDDCVFDGDGTAGQAGLLLVPALVGADSTHFTASEGVVQNCLFRGSAIGISFDTTAAPVGVGSTDNLVQGNRFYTNTLDIAANKTGAGGVYSLQTTDFIGNYFLDKNKATYVDITTNEDGPAASQTGSFALNGFASDTMTNVKIKAVGTGFTFMGNYDNVGIFDGSGLD